jgi:hypothetical protein
VFFVVDCPNRQCEGMSGSADSRLEALEELRKNFDRFKVTKPSLPRPSTKVPIEFAARERVGQQSEYNSGKGLQKGSHWLETFFGTCFPWDQKEMKGTLVVVTYESEGNEKSDRI